MDAIGSSLVALIGRALKWVMVALVVPLGLGVLLGILRQLDGAMAFRATVGQWVAWGFCGYLGMHLLLYRPEAAFRVGHRMFSVLAVWLFGGQVASTDHAGKSTPKSEKKGKGGEKGAGGAQGSTLVAFSPYVVPLYVVLACALGWVLQRVWDATLVNGPIGFLLGATMAFHWLMTVDDLQQQRQRWHLETYLLAIGLIFVITLLIGSACISWTLPDYSWLQALAAGLFHAQDIYTALIHKLFL